MLLLATALTAQAQTHDAAVWTAMLASPDLEGQTRLWLDVHARRDAGRFLSIVRPGVGLQLTERTSAWVGFAWIPSIPDDGEASSEARVWQQLLANIAIGNATLQSRTRIEQRFTGTGGVALRFREFLRLSIPPDDPNAPRLALWDEVFVGANDTDWGAVQGLDQNRLFLGVGLPIRRGGRVEVGLLNVLAPRDTLQVSWVVAANWFIPRNALTRGGTE
ncbi:MAG: DUF2490 domain-containing protein [Myxococcales bacterium]|nr:DUF2490 domain-containing protein [Myxococcales bacterium]